MRAGLKSGGGVGGGVGSGVEGGVGMQMGGRSRYRPGCNTNQTNVSKYRLFRSPSQFSAYVISKQLYSTEKMLIQLLYAFDND